MEQTTLSDDVSLDYDNENVPVAQNLVECFDSPERLSPKNQHNTQPDTVSYQSEITLLKTQITLMQKEHLKEIRQLQTTVLQLQRDKENNDQETRILKGKYLKQVLEGHKAGVYCLQSDANFLVTGSVDKTVRLWNLDTGNCLKVFSGHTSGICCVHYDNKSGVIISGSWDKTIRVWDANSGECRVLKAHVNGVRCLQAQGNTLVSGASDKIIFVWNLEEGECELILKGHESGVYCLQLDEKKLISGSGDRTIRIWELATGKCQSILKGHTGEVYCLKFEGNTLISGAGDKTLRVWDIEAAECLKEMHHPDAVYCCAMNATLAFSGCGDNGVRVWDLRSGECLRILKIHTDGIYCLELSKDRLVTGSMDKTICVTSFTGFF